ncbi:tRNA synthetases class I (M)-domain-containing protein [Ampelomyces quisqualis]|uniref:tRNA synthetases class I (M)-domain-containing protein n=1 Tax=Ampelomyces quisqualis TaxID=50730 RepID=A0A6A5QGQ2_AMPQU|nr:tRNA synthetases class I (M)-domain-containing protein [Ampelomyces quisqualis]
MHAHIAKLTSSTARRVLSGFPNSRLWTCVSCQALRPRNRSISTQPASEKPYYITTPIFYVNAAPHVGHLYTMVLSDIIKRWHSLKGKNALLLTGTDEHGLKVQRASEQAGVDPKTFCDKGAEIFKVCYVQ